MPSDFLTPFLELDEEFCKSFRGLEASDVPAAVASSQQPQSLRVLGFQRRHSLCPVTLPNSKFNGEVGGTSEAGDAGAWAPGRELPRSALSLIPFRVDRSVSMIEGGLPPPPGLTLSPALSPASPGPRPSSAISTRYKTELCRTFEESGGCKYGAKCQFAHGMDELRGLSRHPKYKTEPCRTFHTIGFCPYGARCHFIHNADEVLPRAGATAPPPSQRPRPPLLRHSLSFAGFSSAAQSFQPLEVSSPPLFARASSVSPSPCSSSSSSGSPELLSPLFPEPGALRHCPYPFSATGDSDSLRFYAASDSRSLVAFPAPPAAPPAAPPTTLGAPPGLQRCSSADSLSEEGYASSCSLSSASSSGTESPSFEGRRLPIFSRLSVSDE